MIDLRNKRILVTGASSGIGWEVSILASNLGAELVMIARNTQRLQETYDRLKKNNHELISCDVTDYLKVNDYIKTSVNQSGPFSGFVHCAGIDKTLPLKASTNKTFKEVFETNVFSAFEISRIICQKGNYNPFHTSIVFISSVLGLKGQIGRIVYSSSKSALLAGSKALALEYATKGIRSNCVLPGVVKTEMISKLFNNITEEAKNSIIYKHPLGIGSPSDVASLVCYLLSDKARWITGADYVIDGGYNAK